MPDELETALGELVDAARKIGEWRAEPAPLTLAERGAWNLRIEELWVAEANARQTIHRLFAERLVGLPNSISEALNSGDGTYRP